MDPLGQVLAALQLADAARDRFNLRVLNISLGAPADDPATAPLTEAVERLWADGITVVAAAGNDGGGTDAPGLDPYVLTVGAVDAAGVVPAWSSRGPDFAGRPAQAGPGGAGRRADRAARPRLDDRPANPSARVGDHYFRGSGTSMSTAMVAGAAARVVAAHPEWGPDRIRAALTATADPLGSRGRLGGSGGPPGWSPVRGLGRRRARPEAALGLGTAVPAKPTCSRDLLAAATPERPRASAEVQIRTSEGLERWLRCNHSLLYEGGEWTNDVVIVHDVTRIRQVGRAKTDFVATVSHELRTPITPDQGLRGDPPGPGAQPVGGQAPGDAPDRGRAGRPPGPAGRGPPAGVAHLRGAGGTAVVGVQRECTDLAEAARRAAADWLRGPDSRLELELPPGPLEVDADPLRLVQVLANLISNAHKYSPADQEVRLRVGRDDGWAMAAVADRGRGHPS